MVISSSKLLHPKRSSKTFWLGITASLPKDCIVIGARQTGGIIGETIAGKRTGKKGSDCGQLSILFIPKVPGVSVNFVEMKVNEVRSAADVQANCQIRLGHLLDKQIKFLFLIGKSSFIKPIDLFWKNIKQVFSHY